VGWGGGGNDGKTWRSIVEFLTLLLKKKNGLVTQKEIPTNSRNTNKEVTTLFDFIYFSKTSYLERECRISDFVWLSICRNGFSLPPTPGYLLCRPLELNRRRSATTGNDGDISRFKHSGQN
jgi:hypothetical protein